jgi:hypothetical protein
MSSKLDLIEVKDGLLKTQGDNVLMKARDPELFPDTIKEFFRDKSKVQFKRIDFGLDKVTVRQGDKKSVYSTELIDYVKSLGRIDCYLANMPFTREVDTFLLFVRYGHGWVVVAPLEVR